jgi:uncharacterized protein (TIGR00369 family)
MVSDSLFWKIVDGRAPQAPAARTLGLEIVNVDAENRTIETTFQAKEDFINPGGMVQGGFLTAMLDDTMGLMLMATLSAGEFGPTVALNVQFHRPAAVGPLRCFGRITMRGKAVCQLAAELLQNDTVVATATATAVIRKHQ